MLKNRGNSLKQVSQLTVIKQFFYTSSINAAWVARQKGQVVILKWWRKSVSFDALVLDGLPDETEYWIESRKLNLIILKMRSFASLKYSFNLDSFKLGTTLALLKYSCADHWSHCSRFQWLFNVILLLGRQRATATHVLNTRKMKTSELVRNLLSC